MRNSSKRDKKRRNKIFKQQWQNKTEWLLCPECIKIQPLQPRTRLQKHLTSPVPAESLLRQKILYVGNPILYFFCLGAASPDWFLSVAEQSDHPRVWPTRVPRPSLRHIAVFPAVPNIKLEIRNMIWFSGPKLKWSEPYSKKQYWFGRTNKVWRLEPKLVFLVRGPVLRTVSGTGIPPHQVSGRNLPGISPWYLVHIKYVE